MIAGCLFALALLALRHGIRREKDLVDASLFALCGWYLIGGALILVL